MKRTMWCFFCFFPRVFTKSHSKWICSRCGTIKEKRWLGESLRSESVLSAVGLPFIKLRSTNSPIRRWRIPDVLNTTTPEQSWRRSYVRRKRRMDLPDERSSGMSGLQNRRWYLCVSTQNLQIGGNLLHPVSSTDWHLLPENTWWTQNPKWRSVTAPTANIQCGTGSSLSRTREKGTRFAFAFLASALSSTNWKFQHWRWKKLWRKSAKGGRDAMPFLPSSRRVSHPHLRVLSALFLRYLPLGVYALRKESACSDYCGSILSHDWSDNPARTSRRRLLGWASFQPPTYH